MEQKKLEPEQEFDRFLPCGPKKKDKEASKQKLVNKINEIKNKKVEPEKTDVSKEHECEHYLLTDVAVHCCECGSVTVSGFGATTEYIEKDKHEKELADLRATITDLEKKIERMHKSTENGPID
jgi:hypothetical protein